MANFITIGFATRKTEYHAPPSKIRGGKGNHPRFSEKITTMSVY